MILEKNIPCLRNNSKDFTAENMKKNLDSIDMSTNFLLIIILLKLVILSIFKYI